MQKQALHGINTPLFSLQTKESSGIGEFLDLIPLIDWLKPLGFDIIQLLPLYASGDDPSPYNALSANALNSVYISMEALPGLNKELLASLKPYNLTERIHYAEVKRLKGEILLNYVQERQELFSNDPKYQLFLKENSWLQAFAEFKALKMCNDIEPHKMIQFIAFSQMESVKAHADKMQMQLMGDIPILVSRDSSEVWKHPELFNLNLSAGAPPDMYSKKGQNWGFPIYNYKALANQQYHFWKERLSCASRLYHIYRIDHIVGFFRIWAIPHGSIATNGHYIPENSNDWGPQGEIMLKLMLNSSSMTPIGEDLGLIPKITRETMDKLGIPGTKVIYWERKWKEDKSFIPFSNYPENSLSTLSTHDSEPFSIWWQENPEDANTFAAFMNWSYTPVLSREQMLELLKASHRTASRYHINLLQEYLCIFPELTWGKPTEERINLPGIVSSSNWTYRYRATIEEMATHPDFSNTLKSITQ